MGRGRGSEPIDKGDIFSKGKGIGGLPRVKPPELTAAGPPKSATEARFPMKAAPPELQRMLKTPPAGLTSKQPHSARSVKRGRSSTPSASGVRRPAEGSAGTPSHSVPKLQLLERPFLEPEADQYVPPMTPRVEDDVTMTDRPVEPRAGAGPSSAESSDDTVVHAAALTLETVMATPLTSVAEVSEPPASMAASSGGAHSEFPTPRTQTAEAMGNLSLQPRPKSESRQ